MINLVKAGFGTYREIMSMSDEKLDELLEISQILAILQQEEELDNGINRNQRV